MLYHAPPLLRLRRRRGPPSSMRRGEVELGMVAAEAGDSHKEAAVESPSPGIPSPAGYSTQGKKDPQPSAEGKISPGCAAAADAVADATAVVVTAAPALSPPFSPIRFCGRLGAAAEHPHVTLWEWWPVRLKGEERKLAVSGFTEKNDLFTSAPIAQRYESLTLQDEDGVVVLLHGSFSLLRMHMLKEKEVPKGDGSNKFGSKEFHVK
ncbi:hypothetical protein D1007_49846 [Hordeum vulgare]|nr:hypothetical protein D1007_49846 [Hordeum vulgare]